MNLPLLLASAQAGAEAGTGSGEIVPVNLIWEQVTSLGILEALTFISFGVVCLFYGWRVFKVLVVICFALAGLFAGVVISNKVGGGNNPLLAVILSIIFGILSVPLLRWGVSILGAVAGALITAGLWYACKLPEAYLWAGGLVGLVAGGMISFIIFRVAVMLFSCLGGSGLIVTGLLALLQMYPQTADYTKELIYNAKWFMPVALIVPTAIGIFLQNKFIKHSPNWSV